MSNVIDLQAEREKREKLAQRRAMEAIGAAIFVGVMIWAASRFLRPATPTAPTPPQ